MNAESVVFQATVITESVVYQATVITKYKTANKHSQTYVGLMENSFKNRNTKHKASLNSYEKRNSTKLSKYVWELKDKGDEFTLN